MSGEATNEIYIFFTSQVKQKTYLTKKIEFSFYYIDNQFKKEENFIIHKLTLSSSVLWQQTSEHARVIPNIMFLI